MCPNRNKEDREDNGILIQRLAKNMKYLADENLSNHNITIEQVKILRFLSESPGSYAYQKDIEQNFAIKRSSVTNILQNMEKSELVERIGDESDGRIKRVLLTEKGSKLSKTLKDFICKLELVIVSDMSGDEKELFNKLLKKSLNNVSKLFR
ncbi:MarR family winged helix-turn-helix transcriptional regulator [Anaerocolumna sp. MB42-C2]|uniref:MarR family winged helix-turn-helix transcriptional regulator n=1 Tax=Anaerocolumna sp. MB42-C2 TaxID=3070997 RepID=UPI0027E18FD3|nr:MarR family transcriptional regulator [Anaerocolumna sp. MB42-C2]WMJ88940.1 MarR family transcriptional regulator [Anaerocolumna sp. MB42-C2]